MAMNNIQFQRNLSSVATRRPSPAIWGTCPVLELIENPGRGIYFYDDFRSMPIAPTLTTQIAFGARYKAYAASGCTIAPVTAINSVETMNGALEITMDTDNDEASIADTYPSVYITGSNTTSGKLWFECCYQQSAIVTNLASTFFGLAETDLFTLAANVPNNSGDAIDASGAILGFRIEEDGLGVVDTVVSDRATSFTNIGDTEAGTLAAYTDRKFGFVYDPDKTSDCITFYANNVACATKYTRTQVLATTNLKANPLGLIWSVAADSAGTTFKSYMKWWRLAQLFPTGA